MSALPARARLGWRGWMSIVLLVAASVLVATGGVLLYVQREVADEDHFAARVTSALDDPAVRTVVSDQAVGALLSRSHGDLVAVQPLLVTVTSALVDTPAFRRVVAFGLADTHRALIRGDGSLIVRVEGTGREILAALRSVSPRLASRTSGDVRPVLTRVDRDNRAMRIVRDAVDASGWAWWLLGGGLLAIVAALAIARDRRRATGHLGAAFIGAGLLMAAFVVLVGDLATGAISRKLSLDAGDQRDAIDALWKALFGDLRTAGLLVAAGGLVLAALAAGLARPQGVGTRALRLGVRAWDEPWVRRGTLVAAGLACVLAPSLALRAIIVVVGAGLIFLGLRDVGARLVGRLAQPGDPAAPAPPSRRRDGLLAGLAVSVLLLAATAAAAAGLSAPQLPAAAPALPSEGCNGSKRLCDTRVDAVFWPATHNSYAASDQGGWLFPNQTRDIERQLRDGIRGLTLDVHWGVRDPATGRVRTDLQSENTTPNKVVAEIGPEAVRAAEAVAGRIGVGDLTGPRELYLCHTLCELGAEPLDAELGVIRRFLDTHPDDVLSVIVEDYVAPARIKGALRDAGLLRQAAVLDRAEPLPTLQELIDRDQRLIVFAENHGGGYPWYLPAFSFIQDTPLGATRPSELSCDRWRGDADSPILLMNHWIDRFPPRVSDNARIGRRSFLEQRIARCTRERGLAPGLVAVDFYERGALLDIARERNR